MNVYAQISSNKRRTAFLIICFIIMILFFAFCLMLYTEGDYSYLIAALIFSIPMSLASYYSGDKLALWTSGAKGPITKAANPYIYNLTENLCITAGLPMPKLYIINDPSMNAFATGRDPKHASLALTSGLINNLENEELEGVIAHELSHIKNYDIRLMMVVIICIGALSLMTQFFFRFGFLNGRRERKNNLGLIILILSLIALIITPIIAKLIQLAISRKREFLADASAALLTRYPEGLARALEKINNQAQPLARYAEATAHLYIANPKAKESTWSKFFSTHPPIAERIAALRSIA